MTLQGEKNKRRWLWASMLVVVAALGITPRVSAQALTNADIVKMVQAKLGDAIIINTIKNSTCQFDTSPDALIKLKQSGVSDKVLEAMTEAKSPGGHVPASPSSQSHANIPVPESYGTYAAAGGKLLGN